MPTFQFYESKEDKEPRFKCKLRSVRCEGHTKQGKECKRMVVMGTPWCWMHLLSERDLRIAKSRVPNAGMGLFASTSMTIKEPEHVKAYLMFKNNDKIVEYTGEKITKEEQHRRYGAKTASYALGSRTGVIDSACERSVASFANTIKPKAKCNARFSEGKDGRIWVVATKNIYDGDEILVDYGKEYKLNDGSFHKTK